MARGHRVTVYCRARHTEPSYRGVSLVYLPTWRHKYFDTIVHTFFSTVHLIFHRADVALYCNGANAIFTLLRAWFGIPTLLNVDGLERKRKKWNRLAKAWYRSLGVAGDVLPGGGDYRRAADRSVLSGALREADAVYSLWRGDGKNGNRGGARAAWPGTGRYFLYVSRMEPENNALLVREAFERVDTPVRLALIGDAPYAQGYIERVRDTRDPRVVMPGAIYGAGYHELLSNCLAYIHATEVGGTHPALIEAMGRGALVLYLNTPENAEVAGGVGIAFEAGNLRLKIEGVLKMSVEERAQFSRRVHGARG